MILRLAFIFVFCIFGHFSLAQSTNRNKVKQGPRTGGSFFSKLDRKYAKYFVSFGAGRGVAYWNSTLGSTEIYDVSGNVAKSGDLKFKTKSPFDSYYLEVSMPVSRVRLGLGINFEYTYVDKLKILSPLGDYYFVYPETFRYDKFYLTYEIPFNSENEKIWSVNVKGNLGYFGLSYVDHFNYFGEEALAKTWLFSTGLLADVKLYPHTYVFLNPGVEFKYFNNAKVENPSDIIHKIFGFSVTGGIRIDVSKE